MAMSGTFKWEMKFQLAGKATILLASLGFENHVIEKNQCLFLVTDSSQIAISWVLFQIIHGEIRLNSLDSKVLKGSDRNKALSFREAIALIYALISNEASIKKS